MKETSQKSKKEKNRNLGPERLGDILRALIEKHTGRKLSVQNVRVFEVWDRTVGLQISRVARPQSFQNGKLFVGTLHPTWVTELTFRREELREKLNKACGYEAVKEIIFRLSRTV